ncbi:SGNH/GDSL hydrolase family protein [Microlunatus elymi]|uniref:SGNH/GDSL hydrolase family protein n=1 Tax=Microlunatus elymi TaxID=2596828 RepID=A0A516PX25_9ACTN|nr:SGNH/GDSL hydrolase family protein [Microlunatus elymi]QDP95727.1 SGNH/GDSL hydrolase family protein [Microlunatus elymi]
MRVVVLAVIAVAVAVLCLLAVSAGKAIAPTAQTSAGPLTVVVLGDSVPAADLCGCQGFSELTAARLQQATGREVILHNDAVDGWTSQQVLADAQSGTSHDDLAAGADLVIIEAGANDLPLGRLNEPQCQPAAGSDCFAPTLRQVGDQLTATVREVRAVDPVPDVEIVLMGYWNVSVDGAVGQARGAAYVAASDEVTQDFNAMVIDVSRRTGATYVDAYAALKGGDGQRDPTAYLIADGDHPNAAGNRRLAQYVYNALARAGTVTAWQKK